MARCCVGQQPQELAAQVEPGLKYLGQWNNNMETCFVVKHLSL